jgi:hypothetical protein
MTLHHNQNSRPSKSNPTRTVEQFLAECEQVFREKRTNPAANPPQPETAAELDAFCDKWPDRSYMVRPGDPIWLELMALSRNTGRPVEPFAVEWRERFVVTLDADPEFAATVASLTGATEGGDS